MHFISICRKPKRFVHNGIPKPKYIEMEVSPDFAQNIIGFKKATREFCSKSLWGYILSRNLFVKTIGNGKNFFKPDEYLGSILGSSQINVHRGINLFLNAKLKPIEKK